MAEDRSRRPPSVSGTALQPEPSEHMEVKEFERVDLNLWHIWINGVAGHDERKRGFLMVIRLVWMPVGLVLRATGWILVSPIRACRWLRYRRHRRRDVMEVRTFVRLRKRPRRWRRLL